MAKSIIATISEAALLERLEIFNSLRGFLITAHHLLIHVLHFERVQLVVQFYFLVNIISVVLFFRVQVRLKGGRQIILEILFVITVILRVLRLQLRLKTPGLAVLHLALAFSNEVSRFFEVVHKIRKKKLITKADLIFQKYYINSKF